MSGTFTEKIKLDEEQRQVIIDSVHDEVHEGEMMHAEYYAASVNNNASVDVLITTGESEAHAVMNLSAGGSCVAYLYESPDATGGTAITCYNMKRDNSRVPSATVEHTPSVSGTGSTALIAGRLIPGGTSQTTRVGGGTRTGTEWILAPSTKYLFRVTNISGSTVGVSVAVEFYEGS